MWFRNQPFLRKKHVLLLQVQMLQAHREQSAEQWSNDSTHVGQTHLSVHQHKSLYGL